MNREDPGDAAEWILSDVGTGFSESVEPESNSG